MELKEFNKTVLNLLGKGPCAKLEVALREYYWDTRYNIIEQEVEAAKAAEKFIKQLESDLETSI